ncbi:ABC transporter permease [Halohasta salina]|uniref:ABC transporter permease n=1 Tax=Halohasta salina TaxID=2961621 RepID=UPI0020A3316F|nr:ABC transporter permease [Halohasta salina]
MADGSLRQRLRSQRLTIAGRELRVLGREKTIVLALVIQLFVAGFSGFLVVGLVSLYDPGSVDGYGIEAAVTGDASDEMLAAIDDREAINATEYTSADGAFAAFDEGRAQAVFEATDRDGRIEVVLTAPEGSIQTTLVVSESQEALRALERAERADRAASLEVVPLELPPERGGNPYFDFTYTVLLPLLVFLPVFISGSITVDSITEEVDRGTLELLRVAPVSLVQIVDGKALAMIAIAPLQAMTWLALLSLNGVGIANGAWLFALVTAATVIIVGFAVGISILAADRRSAQLLFSVGVLLLFAGASFLPGSPANVAALLAIDSATTATYAAVGGYSVGAVGVAGAVRWLVDRVDANEL